MSSTLKRLAARPSLDEDKMELRTPAATRCSLRWLATGLRSSRSRPRGQCGTRQCTGNSTPRVRRRQLPWSRRFSAISRLSFLWWWCTWPAPTRHADVKPNDHCNHSLLLARLDEWSCSWLMHLGLKETRCFSQTQITVTPTHRRRERPRWEARRARSARASRARESTIFLLFR